MQNAGGEVCGGTLTNAFANSCDTTFAPLGVQLGGQRLVAMAMRFGFDRPTGLAGAIESTIPAANAIGSPVAVGASAIGQGLVQASTLELADVGATIADHGRRPRPTMLYHARPRYVHVTSSKIAGEVQGMMEAVVYSGTGTGGADPYRIKVAGSRRAPPNSRTPPARRTRPRPPMPGSSATPRSATPRSWWPPCSRTPATARTLRRRWSGR